MFRGPVEWGRRREGSRINVEKKRGGNITCFCLFITHHRGYVNVEGKPVIEQCLSCWGAFRGIKYGNKDGDGFQQPELFDLDHV
ncbi:hypothetical protein L1887_05878 [Cichorium endivia]|nr:hypothetical protein L1887_05878 [Cichorium endivia]